MPNVTVFTPKRIIGFNLPVAAADAIEQAFTQGRPVNIRLDGRNFSAELLDEHEPKRQDEN